MKVAPSRSETGKHRRDTEQIVTLLEDYNSHMALVERAKLRIRNRRRASICCSAPYLSRFVSRHGALSAFAPQFRQQFHLSATQTAFLVAVPVLLGALARLPIGMLADRFGGRSVFTALMFFVAVPVALVPAATSYRNLLIVGFLLGMAGSSFAVGVGYVSRWFSMESQGSALGVYGLGNIGQSAAVFLGPVVAAAYGFRAVYWGMSVILLVWVGVFVIFARNAPQTARPKGFSEMLDVLAREPRRGRWRLSTF